MQEWHTVNPVCVPNQTKLLINSNLNKISIYTCSIENLDHHMRFWYLPHMGKCTV